MNDFVGFTYQAENLCPGCAYVALTGGGNRDAMRDKRAAIADIATERGIDLGDERSFDSDDFPKGIYPDQILPEGETCDSCGDPLGEES